MTPKTPLLTRLKQAAIRPLIPLTLAAILAALTACAADAAPEPTDSPTPIVAAIAAANPTVPAPQTLNIANPAQSPTTVPADPTAAPTERPTTAAAPTTPPDTQIVAAWEQALTSIYDQTLPSIVYIRVRAADDLPDVFQEDQPYQFDNFRWGQGSGFVWDDQGHIITNYHVVNDAAELTVHFPGNHIVNAEIIGQDPHSDLAVIKVDPDGLNLMPAALGDSSHVRPGHLAVAIGAPFGQEFSMTSGIISAVGRLMSAHTQFSIPEVIQTDAALNPGNSGGPLLDRQGRVIGINTSILTETGAYSGVGMAVPVNIARRIVPDLIADGQANYSWLGVRIASVNTQYAQQANLPPDTQGALIIAVTEGSPAAQAGLRGADATPNDDQQLPTGGDIITAINGQKITGTHDLIAQLTYATTPGDTVTFQILRQGEPQQIQTTLTPRHPKTE